MTKALIVLLAPLIAFSEDVPFSVQVREETRWMEALASRSVGTEGHAEAIQRVRASTANLPNVRVWEQSFSTVMPLTTRAELQIGDERHQVHPVWPSSVRMNTTPSDGIEGRLVYVGEARPEQLPAASLRNQIAVMEATGRENWQRAYNAGASAVILLGSAKLTYLHIQSHFLPIPIDVPRFFVPDGALALKLRNEGAKRESSLRGRLDVKSEWKEVTATNFYALVRSPNERGKPALVVAAALDSTSLAPDLAPGADAGIDLAFAATALKEFSLSPPANPVLFAFIDAYAINHLGMRKMLAGIHLTPSQQRKIRRTDNQLQEEYRHVTALMDSFEKDGPDFSKLHQHKFKELHQAVKDEVAREVVAIETEMHPLRLQVFEAEGDERDRLQGIIKELSRGRSEFLSAQKQMLTSDPAREEDRPLLEKLWERARNRLVTQAESVGLQMKSYADRDSIQREMLEALGMPLKDDVGNENSPVHFVLGIDISDASVAIGPMTVCNHWRTGESVNMSSFRKWLVKREKDSNESSVDFWPGELARAVNLGAIVGLESGASYAVGQMPSMTAITRSFGIEGMTWATLDGFRDRVDTPNDTFAALDWKRLNPQIEATHLLLKRLANADDFAPGKPTPMWNRVRGVVVDRSPGQPVPKLPMNGYLTTLVHGGARAGRAGVRYFPPSPGLRRQEFLFTGIDGRFVFEAHPGHVDYYYIARYFLQSYLLGKDGEILRALDLKKAGKGVSVMANIRESREPELKGEVFTCRHIQSFELCDPRFLANLPGATLLDSRRGSEPQRMNFSLFSGIMSCQLEHGLQWQLILRAGIANNRMALIQMAAPEDVGNFSIRNSMKGFQVGERLQRHPVHQSALDMTNLDERRLGDYSKAGITSQAIQELRKETVRLLEEADTALENDDGGGLLRSVSAAMSNEVRAYQAVRDTANDVIRGAIVLLLLLVPFAFATERLILASPFVYRQIVGVAVIFAVMCGTLWSFHPAFRISSQPLMIVMSFSIIFMSLLVLGVIFSKFESGLEEMRSGLAEAAAASTSRYGLAVTAIQLGIANMRKRKFRTALTGITIMLITFALLCFMSASSYSGHREYSLPHKSGFSGVLIRQASMRRLPRRTLEFVDNALAGNGIAAGRYWWTEMLDPQWKVHARNPRTGAEVSLDAGLGLTPEEARLTAIDQHLERWDEFGKGNGCYLAVDVAGMLGVRPGDTVLVGGHELILLSTFVSNTIDRELVDLDGQSLMPYDYSALDEDQRRLMLNPRLDQAAMEMESGTGIEPDVELPRLSSSSVIILPSEPFWGIVNFSLRNLAIAETGKEEVRSLAYRFANLLAFPVFYSAGEEVRVLATTPLLPKAKKSIIIPLVIGGLIIFNTMLSSLAERKREIYIYTSLGLAPLHIGFLFLAEAVTYGLLGSIFGYIVGQGLATLFSSLGWMGNLTLNYSGTQAILTMLLVIIVVVLSSIVPAFLAGKLAVPSNEMSWSVPVPDGDVLRETLPFTVTGKTADGVMAYLIEYMDAHREGSIGNFSTDEIQTLRAIDGARHLGIEGTVWLAPYDLGVRQHIKLSIEPSDEDDIFEIAAELTRESGQTSSWLKLNRVFLGDLRRQLLGWRNLRLDRMLDYIAKAQDNVAKAEAVEVNV